MFLYHPNKRETPASPAHILIQPVRTRKAALTLKSRCLSWLPYYLITKMQNLPTEDRPSTKILEDLIQVRKRLVAIEGSDQPFIKKLKPLLKKDFFLSHALIKFLNYENDYGIKFPDEDELEDEEDSILF